MHKNEKMKQKYKHYEKTNLSCVNMLSSSKL